MTASDERDVEVLRFLLGRRPDAGRDDLARALEAVGCPSDDAAVDAVVDRAGYEVLFTSDGSSVLRPRPGGVPPPAPAAAAAPVAPAAAEPAATPPHPRNLAGAVAIAVVVLLVAILAGVALSRGDDEDEPTAAGGSPTTASTLPASASSPTRPRLAPDGPGSDPALDVEGTVTDDFEREAEGLGELADVGAWTAVRGEWAVADGQARIEGGAPEGFSLATLDVGSVDVRAQVTLPGSQEGAALVFRVVDDQNYWMVANAPSFGTVALVQVVEGEAVYLGNAGLVDNTPDPVIGVNAQGGTIELLVDGAVAATVTDPAPAGTAIGLGTSEKSTEATFDDLRFLLP